MRTTYSAIVAMDQGRGIGYMGRIPWHYASDLKRFKQLTLGTAILMGRLTWESLPKKPLPNRENIVVGRGSATALAANVPAFINYDDAVDYGLLSKRRLFVIGGQRIYTAAVADPRCTTLHVTQIQGHYTADTHMPAFEDSFKLISTMASVEDDGTTLEFQIWERLGEKEIAVMAP